MKVKSSRTLNVPSRPNARTGIMGHYGVMGHRCVKGHHGHTKSICIYVYTIRPFRGRVYTTLFYRGILIRQDILKNTSHCITYDTSNRTN